MEIFAVIACAIIIFLLWQLYRAKQFTRFKQLIDKTIKPQLVAQITAELIENRSDLTPNTDCHIEAAIIFWTAAKGRILQAALEREIININWLKSTGNYKNCQHLFHIEQRYLLAPNRIRATLTEQQ